MIYIAIILLTASATTFLLFIIKHKLVRQIEDMPTSKIRSAPQGYVEIKGKTTLNGQEPLYVPRLKIPCVWYRYHVFYDCQQDEDHEEKDQESYRGIYIDDLTGVCVIHAHLAEIYPKRSIREVESGASHIMSWIGVGEQVYAVGWMNTLHPAPRVNDLISKKTDDRQEMRYGQLTEPLSTLTKHPEGNYPFFINADYEHRILRQLRVSSNIWLYLSLFFLLLGAVIFFAGRVIPWELYL